MKIDKLGKTAAVGTILAGILLFPAGQGTSERLAPRNWQPADANPHLLVTPPEVWEHRDQWLVVDLRDRESYLAGHIPGDFRARLQSRIIADETEVLKIARMNLAALEELGIDRERIKMPQLLDSRIDIEHSGAQPAPPGHFLYEAGARAGRIPNTTINIPHWRQFADMDSLLLKSIPELASMYVGLDREKRTIAYCYIANRASMSYFVMRLLGFSDPAVYHDSWIVWGNNPRLPRILDTEVLKLPRVPMAGGYQ